MPHKDKSSRSEYMRAYYLSHKGRYTKIPLSVRQSPEHKLKKRRAKLLKLYGLTLEQYDTMLEAQGGSCVTCGGNNNGKRLVVDHCHKTGKVRGLLCNRCNSAMGLVDDNTNTLNAMIKYLSEMA